MSAYVGFQLHVFTENRTGQIILTEIVRLYIALGEGGRGLSTAIVINHSSSVRPNYCGTIDLLQV